MILNLERSFSGRELRYAVLQAFARLEGPNRRWLVKEDVWDYDMGISAGVKNPRRVCLVAQAYNLRRPFFFSKSDRQWKEDDRVVFQTQTIDLLASYTEFEIKFDTGFEVPESMFVEDSDLKELFDPMWQSFIEMIRILSNRLLKVRQNH